MAKKVSIDLSEIEVVEKFLREEAIYADDEFERIAKEDLDTMEAAYEDWKRDQARHFKGPNGLQRFMAMLG